MNATCARHLRLCVRACFLLLCFVKHWAKTRASDGSGAVDSSPVHATRHQKRAEKRPDHVALESKPTWSCEIRVTPTRVTPLLGSKGASLANGNEGERKIELAPRSLFRQPRNARHARMPGECHHKRYRCRRGRCTMEVSAGPAIFARLRLSRETKALAGAGPRSLRHLTVPHLGGRAKGDFRTTGRATSTVASASVAGGGDARARGRRATARS